MTDDDRQRYFAMADAIGAPARNTDAIMAFFDPEARINVVHPFNELTGGAAYLDRVLVPLGQAFAGLQRRDDIVMAGTFEDQSWISVTGYYAGRLEADWIGLRPTGELCYLRYGEFHRIAEGRAVESYIFLDIPELMVSCGQWPLHVGPGLTSGYRGLIQGPATHDGVMRSIQDPQEGGRSYDIVTKMLAQLATPDEAWRPYWHPNMMWYGPGAFGSFIGVEAFASFQVPFEAQFDGWSGGSKNNGMTRHFTRFGEGCYTCSGGWPSLTGINVKPFLGHGPSNERVFMRVCDWWRREGDLLVENWVFVDVPHVLLQLGYDPLPKQSG